MGKFQDVNCPICNRPLENGEPIVICPECGAPYHKSCVMKQGKCIYDNLHAAHQSWEMPKKSYETYTSSDEENRCSRCGALNPVDGLFCEVCGNPLKSSGQRAGEGSQNHFDGNRYHGNAGYHMGQEMPRGEGFRYPPQQMPYDPFTTPFGGLNPDETIEDISVKDLAIFVGQNTPYFLPKFKQFSDRNVKISFNFSALFFHGFYFIYRKMYLWGILALLFMGIMAIPDTLMAIDLVRSMIDPNAAAWFDSSYLIGVSNVCSMIGIVARLLFGMFANRIYYRYSVDKIKKIQSQSLPHQEYVTALTKQGSVSMKVIVVLMILYLVASFGISFLIVSTMMV
jgi:hypothetical protein